MHPLTFLHKQLQVLIKTVLIDKESEVHILDISQELSTRLGILILLYERIREKKTLLGFTIHFEAHLLEGVIPRELGMSSLVTAQEELIQPEVLMCFWEKMQGEVIQLDGEIYQ